jgi:hypothetical protein
MKKFALVLTAAAVSFSTLGAEAGGWGKHRSGGNTAFSSGLINISPSIGLGDVTALNNVLSGNAILSGNETNVGILSGIGVSGILNGVGVNVLGGNSYKLRKHH